MAAPNNILGGMPPVPGLPSPNSAWDDLVSDVTAIQLPVDFTRNPAERVGYDNICMRERECKDYCVPEPLCYWQHEWNCENAKQYRWYSKLMGTLASDDIETFNKHTCICQVLKDSTCADRCKIAEQEFLVLLLNVISGKLSHQCCVERCKEDKMKVVEVIKEIDALLKGPGRFDYSCSKALELLTGINQDIILCDSQS